MSDINMKREHNGIDNSPQPSILLIDMPLTQGDLTDHVSGNTMTYNSNYVIWDSGKSAYVFNGSRYIWAILNNINLSAIDEYRSVTVIECDFYPSYIDDDTYYWQGLAWVKSTNPGSGSVAVSLAIGTYTGSYPHLSKAWHHLKIVYDWGALTYENYADDVLYKSGTLSSGAREFIKTAFGIHTPQWGASGGVNGWLKNLKVYTQGSAVAPSAPTNVTAVLNGSVSSVLVTWSTSIGATSYKVYRSSSSSGTYTLLSTINANSYVDNSPLTGMNYYKIIASNSYGDSDYSSAASVDTSITPATPTGLTATPVWDSGLGTMVVELSWNSSAYATSYRYYRSTSAGGTYTLINTIGATHVTDTPSAGITYYYKVSAVNSNGESALSSYVSADTSGTIPSAPTGLTSTLNGSTIDLSWNASSGAIVYEVYRSTTASGTYTLVTTAGNTSASITAMSGDNYIKVKAVNSVGSSDFSNYTYQNYAGASGFEVFASALNAAYPNKLKHLHQNYSVNDDGLYYVTVESSTSNGSSKTLVVGNATGILTTKTVTVSGWGGYMDRCNFAYHGYFGFVGRSADSAGSTTYLSVFKYENGSITNIQAGSGINVKNWLGSSLSCFTFNGDYYIQGVSNSSRETFFMYNLTSGGLIRNELNERIGGCGIGQSGSYFVYLLAGANNNNRGLAVCQTSNINSLNTTAISNTLSAYAKKTYRKIPVIGGDDRYYVWDTDWYRIAISSDYSTISVGSTAEFTQASMANINYGSNFILEGNDRWYYNSSTKNIEKVT